APARDARARRRRARVRRRPVAVGDRALEPTKEIDLALRPVRPTDRDRVEEMTRDVWEGRDYVPQVFDRWVSDAGSSFQAAEVDGVVVGVHRLRPYAPGLIWYEGLRVASTHRRRGIARAMLESAIGGAREHGVP